MWLRTRGLWVTQPGVLKLEMSWHHRRKPRQEHSGDLGRCDLGGEPWRTPNMKGETLRLFFREAEGAGTGRRFSISQHGARCGSRLVCLACWLESSSFPGRMGTAERRWELRWTWEVEWWCTQSNPAAWRCGAVCLREGHAWKAGVDADWWASLQCHMGVLWKPDGCNARAVTNPPQWAHS
jgi:hypothetical protein